MANELTTSDGRDLAPQGGREAAPHNPFGGRRELRHVNEGSIAIESDRAIAEAQAAFIVAQRYNRDEMDSYARFMTVCSRLSFAERAFFKYSRGGSKIEGPSIRFAEEGARCFRNFAYGMLELSNKDGSTEMQAFAQDLESNVRTYQNFTVRHIRDTQGGAKDLTDQRDIYEVGANMGSRRMRARILALLPADYVEDGIARCRETLAKHDGSIPLIDRVKKMIEAFGKAGVTLDMLAGRLGHPVDKTSPGELEELRGVLTALKEGVTNVSDEFPAGGGGPAPAGDAGGKIAAAAAKGAATAPKAAPPKADPPKDKPAGPTPQQAAMTQALAEAEAGAAAPLVEEPTPPVAEEPEQALPAADEEEMF